MFDAVVRWFYYWYMCIVTRRALSRLDDRMLADLGVERSRIDEFARICTQVAAKELAAHQLTQKARTKLERSK
ncbi:DUF1127 domain-containing protein [Devosia sp. XK-2]|uniref:DUF1127 domain-containing protein n=1 Tax=Devosia sp. XK-2 TaxID=3126689 RepID=UPI0030D37778